MLITPLVDIGSPQLDHFAAARQLGLRTVLPVGSWDHLSSKALLRALPDARPRLERGAAARGGRAARRARRSRGGHRRAELRPVVRPRARRAAARSSAPASGCVPDRPFVLYACSSLFRGTADEPEFVETWVQRAPLQRRPAAARTSASWCARTRRGSTSGATSICRATEPGRSGARTRWMPSRRTTTSIRCTTAPAVVGLNTSAFLEARRGRQAGAHRAAAGDLARQPGRHDPLPLPAGRQRRPAARRAQLDEHVPLLADSLAGDGRRRPEGRRASSTGSSARSAATSRRRRDSSTRSRQVGRAAGAGARARPAARAGCGACALSPVAGVLALNVRTQPWRKRTGATGCAKDYRDRWRRRVAGRPEAVRGAALGKRPANVGDRRERSALTPKTRPPARPGQDAGRDCDSRRRARPASWSRVLGRSGRPIIVGPWLSETGFELLYWIPFLAWAKTYGNFDPEQLVVVSRGGAAPWYSPHHAALRGHLLVLHAGRVPRSATRSASSSRADG